MHVPIGVSGVHAVPKTLHSHGLITPLSTSPHWQAFGSATRTPGDLEADLGVPVGELRPQLQGALRDEAQPAPLEVVRSSHGLGDRPQRQRVALLADDHAVYWFSTSQRPSRSWRRSM